MGQAFSTLLLSTKALEWQVIIPRRDEFDFIDQSRLLVSLERAQPDVIINAAAYTQVDLAEDAFKLAYRINAQAVAVLAEAAKRTGAILVHFSTDYVFDGSGDKPWQEEDKPAPLNAYGLSKWQGEQAILASGCRHLIYRTSWLHSPYRHNFVKTMLHLGTDRDSLAVVCDQTGAPTSATMLADKTLSAIKQAIVNSALCGCYHVAARGETNWYEYTKFIFAQARTLGADIKVREVSPVLSRDYLATTNFAMAKRPLNSRLDTTKFCTNFDIELPEWREGVSDTLRQLLGQVHERM